MKFVVQWHITEKCNFRCKHCYQDAYMHEGPSFQEFKDLFLQYLEIKSNYYGVQFTERHINFVGGEPFFRPDFMELLHHINDTTPFRLHIGILTNGSLLTQEKIERLKSFTNLDIHFQISIEGTKELNDSIRGKDSYEKIISAIKLSHDNKFPIHLSFTLTALNKDGLIKMVPMIEKYGLRLKVRRLVPMGIGGAISEHILSPKDWYIFTIKIQKINLHLAQGRIDISGCSEVTGHAYDGDGCAINHHRLLVINHDLELYPCKRLEISLGNARTISLKDAFFSEAYKELLDIHKTIDTCNKCSLQNTCRGGAKCITYAIHKNLQLPDPQCYKALLINTQANVSQD